MAPKHKPRTATKAVGKCKPATAGEKIVMRWGYTLEMCRNDEYYKMRAADVDRAIARAVKKERFRCQVIVCVHRHDWINAEKEIRDGVTL